MKNTKVQTLGRIWGIFGLKTPLPDLPTIPDFPGLYRKYKPCPGVPNVCSKIPDFDRPGYSIK